MPDTRRSSPAPENHAARSRRKAASAPGETRQRFEIGEGAARRFWEIEQKGDVVKTSFGVFGSDGRTVSRKQESPEAARAAVAKAIEEKVAQGYRIPTRAAEPGAGSARGVSLRNPELEDAIDRAPGDEQAYLVYADWLQAQRDPRGELASVQHAKQSDPDSASLDRAEALLLKKFEAELLGPLARFKVLSGQNRSRRCFYWRLGFIERARLWRISESPTLPELVTMLLDHPSGRFVRELILGRALWAGTGQGDLERAIAILVRRAPPTLESLVVGEHSETSGNLERVWSGLPQLRRLTIFGLHHRLGRVEAPALRHLDIRAHQLLNEAHAIATIASARWPKLASLRLRWHALVHGPAIEPILRGDAVPELRQLGLSSIYNADPVIANLVRSRLLPRLTRLDLDLDDITNDGAEALLARADAFQHLESLRITEDAHIEEPMRRRLAARIPALRFEADLEGDDA